LDFEMGKIIERYAPLLPTQILELLASMLGH